MGRAALLAVVLLTGNAAADTTHVRIILDGPWERNAEIVPYFQRELTDLLGDEFGLTFGERGVVEGDWTVAGVNATVDEALADPDVDVIVGVGLQVSNSLATRRDLAKPVVAAFVVDAQIQGVPRTSEGTSGVRNLSYISTLNPIHRDLATFREIVPFEHLAFVTSSPAVESIPQMEDRIRDKTTALGARLTMVVAGLEAQEILDALPPDADAVYLAPLLRVPEVEFDLLVAGLIERKLPSFSLLGRSEVTRGILAGLAPEADFARIARRVALNIQRILLGEDAGDLPVDMEETERLSLNVATAHAIGVRPSWKILTEAEQIDTGRKEAERELDLREMVTQAVTVNLDLLAAERNVAAGRQEIGIARSFLLPQIDVSATGSLIDDDQARNSFGQAAERMIFGSARVSQLLYSDDAWASYTATREFQISRERARDELRLDIAQEAATAYLDLLRARTLERIQHDNLNLTQTNLELAHAREAVGISGPNEVYRWQGEIATARQDLIAANSIRNVSEIQVNRILNRPSEESFRTVDVGIDSPGISMSDPRLVAFLASPWSFRILREFMSTVAIEASPEIQALDAQIRAQNRLISATTRAFFIPTVGLEGEVSHTFSREGEGAEPPPGLSGPEDTQWNVGVLATLPLFTSGNRTAERTRAKETLAELERTRESLATFIDQRVRSATHIAGASYASIDLAREAAEAAGKNLEVVQDGYSHGIHPIIDLLDAQNAALTAELAAANAVYDFLIDLMEVERAAGNFSFLYTDEEFQAFLDRLEAFRDEREIP